MILLIGFNSDSNIAHVATVAEQIGLEYDLIELSEFYEQGSVRMSTRLGEVSVSVRSRTFDLRSYSGIYQRLLPPMADMVAAIRAGETDSEAQDRVARYRGLEAAIHCVSSVVTVINPIYSGWENSCKPLQAEFLFAEGLRCPTSFCTTSPGDLRRFASRRGADIVYKSVSSQRSIVGRVTAAQLVSADIAVWSCPTLFQPRVGDFDVRIHALAGALFPVKVVFGGTDYRYPGDAGGRAAMEMYRPIPERVVTAIATYMALRKLAIAGFDFRVSGANEWWCLEANPSPGFPFFDHSFGSRIAKSLLSLLSGAPIEAGIWNES